MRGIRDFAMAPKKRPRAGQFGNGGSEELVLMSPPKMPRVDYAAIRSKIADGSLLGFAQVWPAGQKHWESKLTAQQRARIYKALEEPISKGEVEAQLGQKFRWVWAPTSIELKVVKNLCEEYAMIFFREEEANNRALEAERQHQDAQERHKQSMMAAKAESRKLLAAWALKHKSMLQSLGADLQWCENEVRQNMPFATDGRSMLQKLRDDTKGSTRFGPDVDFLFSKEDSPKDGDFLFGQPQEIELPLRSYQLDGVRWLAKTQAEGTSVILGDEMGLGKTLQTITYLAHLKFDRSIDGPHLIICPLSVLDHWKEEFSRCCPAMRVMVVYSGSKGSTDLSGQLYGNYPHGYDVVVTTYGGVHSVPFRGFFVDSWWRTVVLDEGHCIKNHNCRLATFLRRLQFVQALILTGTPLQNNLVELWALLNFLYPELFPRQDVFRAAFKIDSSRSSSNNKEFAADSKSLRQIHDFLKVCMLRRMKSLVEVDVPPKIETKIMCPLSHIQRWNYARLLLSESRHFREVEVAAKSDGAAPIRGHAWRKLQFLLMQLRQICNHPYLLPGADPNGAKNIEESLLREPDESFVEASAKLKVLDRLLQRLLASGHRCTVFSQFTRTLSIIEKMLELRGLKFCRLDGSTAYDQRGQIIKDFNSADAPVNIFLLSTRAGGLGINLQTADTCILFDSDWNPQMDLQAMARVHRIGQKCHVHVYRLVAEGTVEERLVNRAQKKLCLDRIVNHNSVISTDVHRSVKEWIEDIQLESSAVVGSGVSTSLSDQEVDAIIDRSRQSDTSVSGIIKGGITHSGADVVEGRVAIEKSSEEHQSEVVARVRAIAAASMTVSPTSK